MLEEITVHSTPRDIKVIARYPTPVKNRLAVDSGLFGTKDEIGTPAYTDRQISFVTLPPGKQAEEILRALSEMDAGKTPTALNADKSKLAPGYKRATPPQEPERTPVTEEKEQTTPLPEEKEVKAQEPPEEPPKERSKQKRGKASPGNSKGKLPTDGRALAFNAPPLPEGPKVSRPEPGAEVPPKATTPLVPAVQGDNADMKAVLARLDGIEDKLTKVMLMSELSVLGIFTGISALMKKKTLDWLIKEVRKKRTSLAIVTIARGTDPKDR